MGGYEGEPDIFSSNNGGSTKFVETKKLGMRGGGALENKNYLPVKVKTTVKVENRSIKVELNLSIFLGLHFW
jgi:hypothetical protein